jgi:hypothetical protein
MMKKKWLCLTVLILLLYPAVALTAEPATDTESGLIIAPGFEQVKTTCTVCHSARLITQNRADRDGWLEMIRWMQSKQGLQELEPELESTILDYLSTNYKPTATSRRPALDVTFPD